MKKQYLAAVAVITLVIASLFAIWQQYHPSQTNTPELGLSQKPKGGDFTLISVKGPVSLHDFKGKLILLYFGYTYCPDICPTNLSSLALAYQQLPKALQEKTQILFISVDPQRDTPKHLQQYSDYYQANIIGLTGSRQQIDEVVKRYGAVYVIHQKANESHYSVDHSAFTYVIDPQGKWVTQMPHGSTPKDYIQIIQQQLGEKTP